MIEWTEVLKSSIGRINSSDEMNACLFMDLKMERVSEVIFFRVPDFDEDRKYPSSSKFVFCSAKVARLVYRNITDMSEDKRKDFLTRISDFRSL